jgi:hypothetical protein
MLTKSRQPAADLRVFPEEPEGESRESVLPQIVALLFQPDPASAGFLLWPTYENIIIFELKNNRKQACTKGVGKC